MNRGLKRCYMKGGRNLEKKYKIKARNTTDENRHPLSPYKFAHTSRHGGGNRGNNEGRLNPSFCLMTDGWTNRQTDRYFLLPGEIAIRPFCKSAIA